MNVAVLTDNDFDKVNGVTTTLTAVLTHTPADLGVRIYTAAPQQVDQPQYLALRSLGVPIPFYAEMRMYIPRVRTYLRHALADRVDLVHLTATQAFRTVTPALHGTLAAMVLLPVVAHSLELLVHA